MREAREYAERKRRQVGARHAAAVEHEAADFRATRGVFPDRTGHVEPDAHGAERRSGAAADDARMPHADQIHSLGDGGSAISAGRDADLVAVTRGVDRGLNGAHSAGHTPNLGLRVPRRTDRSEAYQRAEQRLSSHDPTPG